MVVSELRLSEMLVVVLNAINDGAVSTEGQVVVVA